MENITVVFGKNGEQIGKNSKFDTNVKNHVFPIFKSLTLKQGIFKS